MPDTPEKRRKEDLLCINPEWGHRSSGKQRCGTPVQDGKLMLWILSGMGHPNTPQAYAYTQPRREKQRPRPSVADGELGQIKKPARCTLRVFPKHLSGFLWLSTVEQP